MPDLTWADIEADRRARGLDLAPRPLTVEEIAQEAARIYREWEAERNRFCRWAPTCILPNNHGGRHILGTRPPCGDTCSRPAGHDGAHEP